MTWAFPGPAWLFCPADRPERFAKAAAAADVVILDLEDGVAGSDKAAARDALLSTPLDPTRTMVRVNAADSPEHELDLEALARTGYGAVMLPKCENSSQITALAPWSVVALVETPRGVRNVDDIADTDNVVGMFWGAEDLVAALGGTSSRNSYGRYRDVPRQVRTSVLLSAKAFGRFALDSVYLALSDTDGLTVETDDAAAVGFDGKVALHPRQVPVIRACYVPDEAQIGWANAVLAEAPKHRGVFAFEGQMVDAPVLRHAEALLRRMER